MGKIICFLTEYMETLEAMKQKQVEKLGLLMTRELDKMEQTVMVQRTTDKKLESLKQKRQELSTAHGLDGKTLKEIVESMDGARQEELLELYRKVDGAIGGIQYYNKKAEVIAKLEPKRMGIDSRMMGNPTGIYGRLSIQEGNKLEKKA